MNTKRQTGIAITYTADSITWTASDGTAEPITLAVDAMNADIQRQALFHGLDQKVTDAGAMGMGKWDGEDKPSRYATVAERMQRMRLVAERLARGEWRAKREGGDPLAKLTKEQLEALQERIAGKLAGLGVSGG